MLQTSLKPRFTLRTSLGLISQYTENMFSRALERYREQSGKLPMLQAENLNNTPIPDKIEDYTTQMVPVVKATPAQAAPGHLKFHAGTLPPLLAIEAAIHHHLEKCRSLPAALYVDSHFFLPALAEQHQRIKFTELNGSYQYYTGHQLVSIFIATEKQIDPWALVALGGSIPVGLIISAMSV